MAPAKTYSTVHATLNYYLPPSQGGISTYYPGTAMDKRREHQPREVEITDMRGHESEFQLDKHGFQVVRKESREKDFDDPQKIKEIYYPDCEELLKEATGATKVIATSHIVRRQTFKEAMENEKHLRDMDQIGAEVGATAGNIHVDQSYHGAEIRVRDYLSFDDVQKLTAHTRWAIINVWRPFSHAATRDQLTMCDARSIKETDLLPMRAIFPKKKSDSANEKGESDLGAYYNHTRGDVIELWHVLPPDEGEQDRHRWYFCSGLQPDEALLLKQFDSKVDGTARRSPHSAFSSKEDYGPTRHSLEVRCLVFWEDQERE